MRHHLGVSFVRTGCETYDALAVMGKSGDLDPIQVTEDPALLPESGDWFFYNIF
jgi:hypothetical protein